MSTNTPTTELVVPPDAVPPIVRTVAYYTALVVGALATAASTIAAAVAPDAAPTVAAVGGALAGLVATIAGGVGVAYRPTNVQALPAIVDEEAVYDVGDAVRTVHSNLYGTVTDVGVRSDGNLHYSVRTVEGTFLYRASDLEPLTAADEQQEA